jgi:hypothetical protein
MYRAERQKRRQPTYRRIGICGMFGAVREGMCLNTYMNPHMSPRRAPAGGADSYVELRLTRVRILESMISDRTLLAIPETTLHDYPGFRNAVIAT